MLGAAAPFALEWLGLVRAPYLFEPGRLVIPERAIALPRAATFAVMLYSSVSFALLISMVVGRVRDSLRASEKKLFLQAWYLRQLFPG